MVRKTQDADEQEVTVVTDDGEKPYRLSITIDHSMRKNMRIAAALHDMSPGEWAVKILERAADKAMAQVAEADEE